MYRYLTTPIYYASGTPHLGHAYTTLLANCYRNYYEVTRADVRLITGTDEHGQKIERTAAANATSPAQFAADRSSEFSKLWHNLEIPVDTFVRTTDRRHQDSVISFWNKLVENDDIYLGEYSGCYCVDCEQYFTSGDSCPIHRKPLEFLFEESYFFRLSRYQDQLIRHIEANDRFILPKERRNEVLSLLKNNKLHDLSVSRTSTDWGVPVPGDSSHVIYVWIDALVSYLSALDAGTFQEYWANTTHFIGKDILVFHAIYWPALLLSAGYSLPTSIVVNGWLTVEGRKISKSDPETIVDPLELANRVKTILLVVHSCLTSLSVLGYPFVPDTVLKIRKGLQIAGLPSVEEVGNFRTHIRVSKIEPVFPRLEVTTKESHAPRVPAANPSG